MQARGAVSRPHVPASYADEVGWGAGRRSSVTMRVDGSGEGGVRQHPPRQAGGTDMACAELLPARQPSICPEKHSPGWHAARSRSPRPNGMSCGPPTLKPWPPRPSPARGQRLTPPRRRSPLCSRLGSAGEPNVRGFPPSYEVGVNSDCGLIGGWCERRLQGYIRGSDNNSALTTVPPNLYAHHL